MVRTALVVVSVLFLVACGAAPPTAPHSVPPPDLRSAPTSAVIGGSSVTMAASLSRDFMPISPPDGRPLGGVLRIRTEDGSNIPTDVTADMVWVLHFSETWGTSVTPAIRRSASPVYEVSFADGPKWAPGDTVDVVVRLRDAAGKVALLRAPQQTIGATY
jgi:hypothetical protein